MTGKVLLGILIPFIGTALGAGMVFFLKKDMSDRLKKALLGFAAGVMIAASVWSLLIPAIEMAEGQGTSPWLPAAGGFLLGMGFLLLLDTITPHLHVGGEAEGPKNSKNPPCWCWRSPSTIFRRAWPWALHSQG